MDAFRDIDISARAAYLTARGLADMIPCRHTVTSRFTCSHV